MLIVACFGELRKLCRTFYKKEVVMKIMMLMLVVMMHYGFLYTMQECFTCDTTDINLKEELFDLKKIDGKSTFICSGMNEQHSIDQQRLYQYCAGDIHIYHRKSIIIEVAEPLLEKSSYDNEYSYYVERRCLENKSEIYGTKWYGNNALDKASDHLALCYAKVLAAGLNRELCGIQQRSIAFPEIAQGYAFPAEQIALIVVPEIIKFIKKNPKAYARVDLYVRKESAGLYKRLLDFYLGNIVNQDNITLLNG